LRNKKGWRLFPFAFKKDKYKIIGKIFINNKKIRRGLEKIAAAAPF